MPSADVTLMTRRKALQTVRYHGHTLAVFKRSTEQRQDGIPDQFKHRFRAPGLHDGQKAFRRRGPRANLTYQIGGVDLYCFFFSLTRHERKEDVHT